MSLFSKKDPNSWNGKLGDWMDKTGACKVCGGEIPHGHSDQCDYYKLEHENRHLKMALEDIAKMPEYDQDDAHRLRDKAKKALKL